MRQSALSGITQLSTNLEALNVVRVLVVVVVVVTWIRVNV